MDTKDLNKEAYTAAVELCRVHECRATYNTLVSDEYDPRVDYVLLVKAWSTICFRLDHEI